MKQFKILNWQLKVKTADGNTAWRGHSHTKASAYIYSEILHRLQMDVDRILKVETALQCAQMQSDA